MRRRARRAANLAHPGPPDAVLTEPLRWLLRGLVDLAFPPRCAECEAWLADPLCGACREALPEDLAATAVPRRLDACVAAVAYSGSAANWIQRFKYPARDLSGLDPAAIGVVCQLIVDAGARVPGPAPDAVVPVPLHPARLRARGFNPAGLLARELARRVGAPYRAGALVRARDTPSQTGFDRRERKRNVRGAFRCASRLPRRVWLVDDVVTTGATLSECARVLRRAGVRRVAGVCVARTPSPDD